MANDQKTTAKQLSGEHIWQLVRIAPGEQSVATVSGRLEGVAHSRGNMTRVSIYVDEKNTVELFLRSGVVIEFFHPAESGQ